MPANYKPNRLVLSTWKDLLSFCLQLRRSCSSLQHRKQVEALLHRYLTLRACTHPSYRYYVRIHYLNAAQLPHLQPSVNGLYALLEGHKLSLRARVQETHDPSVSTKKSAIQRSTQYKQLQVRSGDHPTPYLHPPTTPLHPPPQLKQQCQPNVHPELHARTSHHSKATRYGSSDTSPSDSCRS